jgi:hypothetical protein
LIEHKLARAIRLQNSAHQQEQALMSLGRVMGTILVLGAGALALGAVIAAPKLLQTARPLVREGLRRGMSLYDRARVAAAEFGEDVEDLVAEVRSDMASTGGGEAAGEGARSEAS